MTVFLLYICLSVCYVCLINSAGWYCPNPALLSLRLFVFLSALNTACLSSWLSVCHMSVCLSVCYVYMINTAGWYCPNLSYLFVCLSFFLLYCLPVFMTVCLLCLYDKYFRLVLSQSLLSVRLSVFLLLHCLPVFMTVCLLYVWLSAMSVSTDKYCRLILSQSLCLKVVLRP